MSLAVPSRHARMLQILRFLQSGQGLNASELARQAEVSRRTIFRDLHTLREAGIPVHYDDNADCYRLGLCDDLVPIPQLDRRELTALVAAIHLSLLRQLPDCHELLRQTVHKLLEGSPSGLRRIRCQQPISCAGIVDVGQRIGHRPRFRGRGTN